MHVVGPGKLRGQRSDVGKHAIRLVSCCWYQQQFWVCCHLPDSEVRMQASFARITCAARQQYSCDASCISAASPRMAIFVTWQCRGGSLKLSFCRPLKGQACFRWLSHLPYQPEGASQQQTPHLMALVTAAVSTGLACRCSWTNDRPAKYRDMKQGSAGASQRQPKRCFEA